MPDRHADQLSLYLDGELCDSERRGLERHLESCAECRAILADLRAIVAAAPHYQGRPPSRDLWPAIEARLADPADPADRVERAGSRPGPFWPVLLAASLALAVVGGGVVWWVRTPAREPARAAVESPARGTVRAPARTVAEADRQYQSAVADLERILAEGRDRLDTATVRVVEESLRKIDAAIAEARAAIARDSSNAFLGRSLAANLRRKLTLLRAIADALART